MNKKREDLSELMQYVQANVSPERLAHLEDEMYLSRYYMNRLLNNPGQMQYKNVMRFSTVLGVTPKFLVEQFGAGYDRIPKSKMDAILSA